MNFLDYDGLQHYHSLLLGLFDPASRHDFTKVYEDAVVGEEGTIYFTTDTHEIVLNGQSYSSEISEEDLARLLAVEKDVADIQEALKSISGEAGSVKDQIDAAIKQLDLPNTYETKSVVKDLSVTGTVTPGGSKSSVGAIAGRNDGQILLCIFSGRVVGGDYIGGIAGSNSLTGLIENCHVDGAIYGNHFVGGIAGENTGVIRSCSNNATELSVSPCCLPIATCVATLLLPILLVIAATITVGLYLFPILFCKISTGRTPPCSDPTTGDKSA